MLLSVCIPTYNRGNLFRYFLYHTAKVLNNFNTEVELIVSDNNSSDNIIDSVNFVKSSFKSLSIIYHKANEHSSLAINYLRSVSYGSGFYSWIIGTDDFINSSTFDKLLQILRKKQYSLISINFNRVFFTHDSYFTTSKKFDFDLFTTFLLENSKKRKYSNFFGSNSFSNIEGLIHHKYENVYLGAMMTVIFKSSVWKSNQSPILHNLKFNDLDSIYPHLYMFGKYYTYEPSYYLSDVVITAGENIREWAKSSNGFWTTYQPVIYLKVFTEITKFYRNSKLKKSIINNIKNFSGTYVGKYLPFYLIRKYIYKLEIKESSSISEISLFKFYLLNFNFWINFFKSLIKSFYLNINNLS